MREVQIEDLQSQTFSHSTILGEEGMMIDSDILLLAASHVLVKNLE